MKITLTKTQLDILNPLINAKNEAENKLIEATRLVAGRGFKSCSIKDGVLEIVELEKPEENDSTGEN
jgi:hypothetical protein